VLYLNEQRVQSVSFDEAAQSVNNIDFSESLQTSFLAVRRINDPFTVKLALEDYTYNSLNQGFRMSYLLQTTFTDKSPPSADGAPISFSLDYSAPL